jgi:hypothetical protein
MTTTERNARIRKLAKWRTLIGDETYSNFENMAGDQAMWVAAKFGKPTRDDVEEVLLDLLEEYGDKYDE